MICQCRKNTWGNEASLELLLLPDASTFCQHLTCSILTIWHLTCSLLTVFLTLLLTNISAISTISCCYIYVDSFVAYSYSSCRIFVALQKIFIKIQILINSLHLLYTLLGCWTVICHNSQKLKKKKYIQNSIPKHLLLYLFLATHIVLEFAIDTKINYFELKFSIDSKRLHNCVILLNKLKECYNLFSTSSFCTKCLSCMPQNVLSVIFSGRVSLVLLINEPV